MSTPSPEELDEILEGRDSRFTSFSGEVSFRALPALSLTRADELLELFCRLSPLLSEDEKNNFRTALDSAVLESFHRYGSAEVTVHYQMSPSGGVEYSFSTSETHMADRFEEWVERGESLFGMQPDAKVLGVAQSLGAELRVLDLGAGNGRNALALAALGHRVVAVELTDGFAERIREAAQANSLDVQVLQQDFLETGIDVPGGAYDLVVLSQVTSHFGSPRDLARVLARLSELLSERGRIVVTIFVGTPDYDPTPLAREVGVARWATFYAHDEVERAAALAKLELVSRDRVVDYEREHLPSSAWPPTSWFVAWAEGRNIFPVPKPPVALEWFVYQRTRL